MTETELIKGKIVTLESDAIGNISDRRWRKMQGKEFRKLAIKKFGRPEHPDIKYVSFILTKEHALIEITSDKVNHKMVNSALNQYPLGHWTFVETRPEFRDIVYWFGGAKVYEDELVVRSFYRTNREDAIAILKND